MNMLVKPNTSSATTKANVLIVDDELSMRAVFRDMLEELGCSVSEAENKEALVTAIGAEIFDVIVLDLVMPGSDGIELLRTLSEQSCRATILLSSGQDRRILSSAQRMGRMAGLNVGGILQKPVTIDAMESAIGDALQLKRASQLTRPQIESAIQSGQIVPYFQPKVDLLAETGAPRVVGAEALVRWVDDTGELRNPGDFLAEVEAFGLMPTVTSAILSGIVDELLCLQERNGAMVPISINVPPTMLHELDLPDQIFSHLRKAGLGPEWLVIEVTEESAMQDPAKAIDILTRLRLKGFSVSLDDFGTGFTSIVELYRMPFSELKLDRSIICDLSQDEDARTVARGLVALSHELGMPVCAEGVEDQDTADFLRSIGCERAQGFHFAKPLPADEFTRFVVSFDGTNGEAVT